MLRTMHSEKEYRKEKYPYFSQSTLKIRLLAIDEDLSKHLVESFGMLGYAMLTAL
jgi:hypothetical protein